MATNANEERVKNRISPAYPVEEWEKKGGKEKWGIKEDFVKKVQEFKDPPSVFPRTTFRDDIDRFWCKMAARTIRFECFYFHQKIFIFRKVTADLLPLAVQSDPKFGKLLLKKYFCIS